MQQDSLTSNSLGIPVDSNRPGNPLELGSDGHAQNRRHWKCKRCGMSDVHPLQSRGLKWLIATFGYWHH
jgi:hypothetical protein